ncbi:arylsulfatase [Blastopirellula sp. JC732]|uniref:Arylsulfatase n=1 Tax=Blastopirellula sediminis TaxID=2894196 RepID=A0A9X1MK20_9BACT|nr:arylsulfatase [Blastopirellula sediminis]MCC9609262.1 arylsulfatase [Blastopirellula sediminis]MCC9627961.1 arylsulfatase [Blastopirellula sediminis]
MYAPAARRPASFLIFALSCCALSLLAASPAVAADRPNVIIMMVDDLGFSDFGCYGSEIETPNIDALADGGLRFRNFYNTAKCHSSRVSLLTGLYCDQAGAESLSRGVTIAEVLGKAGYNTAMVGKWHLHAEPTDRGFQKYFGHLSGATNYFVGDNTFRLNGEKWDDFDEDFYTTDANLAWAEKFLSESLSEDPDKPFFLYIAHNAPHYPLQAREEDFRKYEDRYREGWDKLRAARYQRQIEMGLIPKEWALSPRPEHVPAWDELSAQDRDWERRRMAAFAAMVDRVDQTTGQLVQFLKQKEVFDNTLILICSDNGACPFDRTKGKEFEPWDSRSYWCYDTGWSHVGNTPFRLHKQNQHEGGISSPLIVHWPAGLKTKPGAITDQTAHLIDFMATCVDVGQTEYPAAWPERKLEPLQGKSLLPILQGKTREPHDFLYFHFATNRAIRQGKWKLVTHRASQWELYDIEKDGTELHNVAAEHPKVVQELSQLWHKTAVETDHLKPAETKPVSGKTPPLLNKNGTPAKN